MLLRIYSRIKFHQAFDGRVSNFQKPGADPENFGGEMKFGIGLNVY